MVWRRTIIVVDGLLTGIEKLVVLTRLAILSVDANESFVYDAMQAPRSR